MELPNPSRPPVSEQIAAAAGRFRVLTPGIVGGFVVIVVLLIGTFAVSLANLRSISSTGDAVTRTYSVIVALDRLLLAAERTAKAQETELREALQLKDEFVTLVSHELRTPRTRLRDGRGCSNKEP